MRRLIVCCDGTWATAEDETVTNVRRFANALADSDEHGDEQLTYYQPGVGTEGPLLARLMGAATGAGLSHNVLDAYHWLAARYQPGDGIAVVGFSRGAYTARSLAGMISFCGFTEDTDWPTVQHLYEAYRRGQRTRDGLTFRFDPDRPDEIPVDLVAVWDTVGALGIPDYLGGFDVLDPVHRYDFHNVTLNPHIRYGRHAVAMDETRRPFAPTLWSRPYGAGQDVAQVWFPGSHQDVGGGHTELGLSDGALLWMIDEARQAVGLGFHKSTVEQIRPDPLDLLHDDDAVVGPLRSVVEPLLEVLLQPRPRAVPPVDPEVPDESIHVSAYERNQTPSISGGRYRPTRRPKRGQSMTVEVAAERPWSQTGLYLDPGEYEFSADGQWRSGGAAAGPEGSPSAPARAVASWFTAVFRRVTGQPDATFLFSRRDVDLPWLSLVAVVANDAYERIPVGTRTRHRVRQGGYLYAYANDAWGEYGNNQGGVALTVARRRGATRKR